MIAPGDAARFDPAGILRALETSENGLTSAEALARRARFGPNSLGERRVRAIGIFARQLRNPLLLLLVVTAITSLVLGEHTDAFIILAIIALSVGLGFANEFRSERAMLDLTKRVRHRTLALRDGKKAAIDVTELVPGDVVAISVGDVVPADLRLISATALECDEAILTGESVPVEKNIDAAPSATPALEARCLAFMGTTVKAGTARGVVIATGAATEFGNIAAKLAQHPPETAFQQGLRRFSGMLVNVTVVLTIGILVVNAALRHPLLDSLLFALAIAVGLTPQLLPAIVTVSLATGAAELAKRSVVVKRLVSIEDLGNIEVLYSDKTGTLTQGQVLFEAALDERGDESEDVFRLGLACSAEGENPLDSALWQAATDRAKRISGYEVIAEAPFDYERKRMSSLVKAEDGTTQIVTKGAPESVMRCCAPIETAAQGLLDRLFASGARVVAIATRAHSGLSVTPADECDLRLRGFLTFADPIKPDAAESLERLRRLGIDVRILTGDNERVARNVCEKLGIEIKGVLSGEAIDALSDAELADRLAQTTIFARVTPEAKSRIVRLERELGTDVGFLGDGVNDAVALHHADVGISVDSGTDVAKDAADIILLEKDLDILADGVVEGRRIFSNTIKYVLMGTSSNFGNMFSAAGASLFLSFLPMTAPQILLNNLLYDVSEMTIPTDRVDEELLERPSRWDIGFIRRFMIIFGPISSIFDYATFGVMLWFFHAQHALFQSGWFVESLLTQTLVIFAIRTKRIPFFRSSASLPLTLTSLAIVVIGATLPFTPLGRIFGFVPLPALFFAILLGMMVLYLALVEAGKAFFYKPAPAVPAPSALEHERRMTRVASRWLRRR